MNDTVDVILVNRCNQSDEFRTVLPAKICARVLLILMLAAAAVLVVGAGVGEEAAAGVVSGAEWDVYLGESIQDAIDGAGEGDTIYVHAGTYVENVNVWKRVTLIGDGADVVTVRAADVGDHVFNVTADYVDISGFNVTGATEWGRGGICLNDVNKCTISNNTASGNCYGIYLSSSSNNNLTSNTASDNSRGILLDSSSNNNLTNNTANSNNYGGIYLSFSSNNNLLGNTANLNNAHGILLDSSSNNTLTGNTMVGDGISIWGSELPYWNTHFIDTSNTVNGKQVCYWKNQVVGTVPPGAGQVILTNCTNVIVENQNVSGGTVGIIFGFSDNNTLTGNIANSNNKYGIDLRSSSNNTLTGNTANSNNYDGIWLYNSSNDNNLTDNTASNNNCGIDLQFSSNNNNLTGNTANSNNHDGIGLYSSNNNTLTDNTVNLNNDYGIYLDYSSINRIYLNNFISNDIHVYTRYSANIWNSTSPITYTYNGIAFTNYSGNYWDSYTDVDADGDGIWDTPYSIDSDNQDNYPLVDAISIAMMDGDLNSDGTLTPADAAIALNLAVSGGWDPAADVSGDSRITSLDALMILQAAADAIDL